jgi:O-ureido-D-serine cyclo-ligase
MVHAVPAPHIALVTAAAARGFDEDLDPLSEALHERGASTAHPDWHDPDVDWSAFDLALVRSTWDYTDRRDEFLDWARRAGTGTRLEHPAEVLAWNTDKHYLADLAAAGVEVVPTTFLLPGDPIVLPEGVDVVVKPTIGAGSRDTARHTPGRLDAARAHVERLHAEGRAALVQPYLGAIDTDGEAALLCFGGRFSHAITKGPLLAPDAEASRATFAPELITARTPTPDELAAADAALAALASMGPGRWLDPPLYARVDLLRTDEGRLAVLELELCEPAVFLATSAGSADRFADAVLARVAETSPVPR